MSSQAIALALSAALLLGALPAIATPSPEVVDLTTRAGVSQRLLVLTPPKPKAAVVLFAGGHGGLQISPSGSMQWGAGNFLIRSRQLFADQGLMVVIVDAPSDRQSPPFLLRARQSPEHAADIKAVIAWLRQRADLRVWLIGTSRGTESAAHVATQLSGSDGPDGIVLTATILAERRGRPVPAMPLETLRLPVLVVHHEDDACPPCNISDMPALTAKLRNTARTEVLTLRGGESHGDPCQGQSHHGFKGIEAEVVERIATWILAR